MQHAWGILGPQMGLLTSFPDRCVKSTRDVAAGRLSCQQRHHERTEIRQGGIDGARNRLTLGWNLLASPGGNLGPRRPFLPARLGEL